MNRASFFLSIILAALLLPSAFIHRDNPYNFLSSIYAYRILSETWGPIAAQMIPFLQLSIVAGLFAGRRGRRPAFLYAFVMLLSFTILQIATASRGLNIACGCFGTQDENPIGARSIAIAAGGTLIALAGFIVTRKPPVPT